MLAGWIKFVRARQKRERGELLALHSSAARGDPKAVKKMIKQLGQE